jgi:hypothetical protein
MRSNTSWRQIRLSILCNYYIYSTGSIPTMNRNFEIPAYRQAGEYRSHFKFQNSKRSLFVWVI